MCEGRVLFHSHVHKSAEESAAQQEEVDERDRLKAERRRQQVRAHAAPAPSVRVIWLQGVVRHAR